MTQFLTCLQLSVFFDELQGKQAFAIHTFFWVLLQNCCEELFELF